MLCWAATVLMERPIARIALVVLKADPGRDPCCCDDILGRIGGPSSLPDRG